MIAIYILILVIALWSCKKAEQNDAFVGKAQSGALKGIFVLLVFASHSWGYIKDVAPQGILTDSFLLVKITLGQMIVVPFMFFSGYGIRYSAERKGDSYIRSMPKKRILNLWLHTLPILLMFLCLQLALGKSYDLGFVLSCLLFWNSIGNSNWYIFAILFLYIASYLSFRIFTDRRKRLISCLVLTLSYIAVMSFFKSTWWYDTVLAYFFGLCFYDFADTFRDRFAEKRGFKRGIIITAAALLGVAAAYLVSILFLKDISARLLPALIGNLVSVVFMLLLLIIALKLKIGNPVINWLGDHVFEVYLLQRLPMILFTEIGLCDVGIVPWYLTCIAVTLILTLAVKRLNRLTDGLIK